MRRDQRRESARGWVRSGATVTVGAYARRYGVDRYTAYEDLTAIGVALPISARKWAQRPPSAPRRRADPPIDPPDDPDFILVDGRMFFVAGYTAGGAPFGAFLDEDWQPDDEPDDELDDADDSEEAWWRF